MKAFKLWQLDEMQWIYLRFYSTVQIQCLNKEPSWKWHFMPLLPLPGYNDCDAEYTFQLISLMRPQKRSYFYYSHSNTIWYHDSNVTATNIEHFHVQTRPFHLYATCVMCHKYLYVQQLSSVSLSFQKSSRQKSGHVSLKFKGRLSKQFGV